jgi:hypothetical protein
MATINDIMRIGLTAQGKSELVKYLEGSKLSFRQAIISKCYECMGYYIDGKVDCGLDDCPLYPIMPYGKIKKAKKLEPKKPVPPGFKRAVLAPRVQRNRAASKKLKGGI